MKPRRAGRGGKGRGGRCRARGVSRFAGLRLQAWLAEGPPAFARFPCDSMEPKFANPWLSRWFSKRLPGARLPGAGVQ